jgi:hypothetical protein
MYSIGLGFRPMSNETHSTLIHINSKSVQDYSIWTERLVKFLDGKIIFTEYVFIHLLILFLFFYG